MKRNYLIDQFRGLTIISMVIFHTFYDISLYRPISWYDETLFNHIWQLSIACSFFIISGLTSNFLSSRKNIERGVKISLLGFLITFITYIFDKNLMIVFGVLNGLGLSMIITGILQDKFNIDEKYGPIFLILFILSYRIPRGEILGFPISLNLYSYNLFPLGFPSQSFRSTDYFPIIPWFFIYFFGYLFGKKFITSDIFKKDFKNNFLAKIGQNSLKIYLAHQIIIYFLVNLYFTWI